MGSLLDLEPHEGDVGHNLIIASANDVVVACGTRALTKRARSQINTPVHLPCNVGCVSSVVHSLD